MILVDNENFYNTYDMNAINFVNMLLLQHVKNATVQYFTVLAAKCTLQSPTIDHGYIFFKSSRIIELFYDFIWLL